MTSAILNGGVCRNLTCPVAVSGEIVDRYPGPGEYCPECGDLLDAAAPAQGAPAHAAPAAAPPPAFVPAPPPTAPPAPPAATVAMTAPTRPQRPQPAPRAGFAAAGIARRFKGAPALGAVAAVAVAATFVVVGPIAARQAGGVSANVCTTSSTARLAMDLVHGYGAKSGSDTSHFAINSGAACDVRFAVAPAAARDAAAHDAFVVVVNPQNPTLHLTAEQIGGIFAGKITDWSQVGGSRGAIVALLPPQGSDEANALASLTRVAAAGPNVRRLATSADVTRAVASAAARNAVGFVTFSAAVPARVLAIDAMPSPSSVTIANHRYPLAVDVVVRPDGPPSATSSAFVDYARSESAQAIVAQDGFVAQKGF